MKKLIQCIAFLVGCVPLFAIANPTTPSVNIFGTPSFISGSPAATCVPGKPGFCSCWQATFRTGCETTPPFNRNPRWCTTAHIVGMVEKIGVAAACLESPDPAECRANFTSYIYNQPANHPTRCPLS